MPAFCIHFASPHSKRRICAQVEWSRCAYPYIALASKVNCSLCLQLTFPIAYGAQFMCDDLCTELRRQTEGRVAVSCVLSSLCIFMQIGRFREMARSTVCARRAYCVELSLSLLCPNSPALLSPLPSRLPNCTTPSSSPLTKVALLPNSAQSILLFSLSAFRHFSAIFRLFSPFFCDLLEHRSPWYTCCSLSSSALISISPPLSLSSLFSRPLCIYVPDIDSDSGNATFVCLHCDTEMIMDDKLIPYATFGERVLVLIITNDLKRLITIIIITNAWYGLLFCVAIGIFTPPNREICK